MSQHQNFCAYHPQNHSVVRCSSCNRSLCPSCDHRIKGFAFCQDCIVSGIELLRHKHSVSANSAAQKSSPFLAVLFSLICPGLGAAYNGQNSKALIHFGIFVGLFQMAVLTGTSLFVLGFLGVWLFAALDAWRSARAVKLGLAVASDDLLTRQFAGNSIAWALALISLGTLFYAHTMLNLHLPIRELLPILLIGLGVYLIINFVRNKRSLKTNAGFLPQNSSNVDEDFYSANSAKRFGAGKFSS